MMRKSLHWWLGAAMCVPLLLLVLPAFAATSAPRLRYVKRATREETQQATLAATARNLPKLEQSPWRIREGGTFTVPPGGELQTEVTDTEGRTLWRQPAGWKDGTEVVAPQKTLAYRTVTVDRDVVATVRFRVDKGITFYVNGIRGHMTVTTYIPPLEELRIALALRKGVNHLAIELGWMGGGPVRFLYELSALPLTLETELTERLDQDFPGNSESAFYRLDTVAVPKDIVLEVGGMKFVSLGAKNAGTQGLFVATRRGEVWLLKGKRWQRFASGLAEPLGLWAEKPNEVYVVQRTELTKLSDINGDGRADDFHTIASGWEVSGGHHEYAFGLVRDDSDHFFMTLCSLGDTSRAKYLGWALRLGMDGSVTPWASGLRCPNGIARSPTGDIFVSDNQGEYVATSSIYHVTKDAFFGHPRSLNWHPDYLGRSVNQIPIEELDKARTPAAVLLHYGPMGQSPSQPIFDTTGGKFGPFEGQMFIGDQTTSAVYRVAIEKVQGQMQGAAFPFRAGFQSGNNRAEFAADGRLWVGQTDRGWGAIGGREFGLQTLTWTGKVPFEVHHIELTKRGFDVVFTKEVNAESATNVGSYVVQHLYYPFSKTYGVTPQGHTSVKVTAATVSSDRKRVSLELAELKPGKLFEIKLPGVRDAQQSPLLHSTAYYTLNKLLP